MRHFAVFRQPDSRRGHAALAGPSLPAALTARLTLPDHPFSTYLVNPTLARDVTTSSGLDVWVVPGSAGVCLVSPTEDLQTGAALPGSYTTSCDSLANADAGQTAFTQTTADGTETVVGLVPDGNTSVTVTQSNGATIHAPVVDNVFAYSGRGLQSYDAHNASGQPVIITVP